MGCMMGFSNDAPESRMNAGDSEDTASATPRHTPPRPAERTATHRHVRPQRPLRRLPPLPPAAEVGTASILKKAITASRALAELKGMVERMPNQAMLIDSLELQEARASS